MLDGAPPSVLRPLPEPRSDFPVSGSVYVPLYRRLYVGGQRSLISLARWGADAAISLPVVEAVIVGAYGTKSVSFVSRGENRR
jgi:hypothetical protein